MSRLISTHDLAAPSLALRWTLLGRLAGVQRAASVVPLVLAVARVTTARDVASGSGPCLTAGGADTAVCRAAARIRRVIV